MPFLRWQWERIRPLPNAHWTVVEGAADNQKCTRWCQRPKPGLSTDGTTEFLDSIESDRVIVIRRPIWFGKVSMVNAALEAIDQQRIHAPQILMELDVDEFYTPEQFETIRQLFENDPTLSMIRMPCRYWIGPDLLITSKNCYGNRHGEWLRVWRFRHGMRFSTHEPPVLDGNKGKAMNQEEAASHGLTFDHLAYVFSEQVERKCRYYGYYDGLKQWLKLQDAPEKEIPDLRQYLPWVGPGVTVERVKPCFVLKEMAITQ